MREQARVCVEPFPIVGRRLCLAEDGRGNKGRCCKTEKIQRERDQRMERRREQDEGEKKRAG